MTIEKWLKNVYYDEFGTHIWNKDKEGDIQKVADIRGWGAIQNLFKTQKEAEEFQDEVGKFIADAINEKVQRDFGGNK
jgi:hypothetical protein